VSLQCCRWSLVAVSIVACVGWAVAADFPGIRGYPTPLPEDVSYERVVGSQRLPPVKYPVTVIGAAYHPEEVHVTPSGELMFPYVESFKGLCIAPLVGSRQTGKDAGPVQMSLPPVEAIKWRLVDGYMPGVENQWTIGDIELKQLAFATAGGGFLSTTGREPLVTLARYTLTNKSSSPREAVLAIVFGQAYDGLSMKSAPPAYPQELAFDAPSVRQKDGAVVARLLSKNLSVSFKPLGALPEPDPAHYFVLNEKGESIKGPDFAFDIERSGDSVTVGKWQAPAGADLYIEAGKTHTLPMLVDLKIVGPDGTEQAIGTMHRGGFSAENRGATDYIAPGQHTAAMPWSELAKRLPQGKTKIVAHCRIPADAPVKEVGSWEPRIVFARPGIVPKFVTPGDRYTDENRLSVSLSLEPGQSKTVDLAIPYYPLSGGAANLLAELNIDDSLAAFRKFWSAQLNNKAQFIVPEKRFRDAYRACLAYNMILTDRDPRSGVVMPHPDATVYEAVWAGDGSVAMQAFERMGYHKDVESMLNYFLARQGRNKPDGDVQSAEGYFSGDNGEQWMNQNGFVLWALGEHYKLSHDDAWLRRVAPQMIKACQWTIRERARTKVMENGQKVRHYGLLPKGRVSDLYIWDNWYWTDTYTYMGLRWTADVLPAIGMKDEAAKLAAEADDYKACILDSIARSIDPKVKPALIPPTPYRNTTAPSKAFFDEVWYMVCSPAYMVEAGLLDARDERIAGTCYWIENESMISGLPVFGEMGIDPHYVYNQAIAQLLRSEHAKFTWTLYSLSAYGQAQGTYATIEGHDIVPGFRAESWSTNRQPHIHSNSRFIDMVRIALLLEEKDTLHLMAGTPRGWLADGKTIEVKRAPSYFGEVNYVAQSRVGSGEVAVDVEPTPWQALKVILHVRPPTRYGKIKAVKLNGADWTDFDGESVRLPPLGKKMNVLCMFQLDTPLSLWERGRG
jgi:hypothetical protein